MNKKKTTKEKLIAAFENTEVRTVTDACSRAGFTLGTFYFHFYKDSQFKRKILEIKQQKIADQVMMTV